MTRIALGIEYDGSDFYGWQSQAGGNTVQDALEAALAGVAGTPVRVHCAGRTDTGVHALAQVVHFDAPTSRPVSAWVRGTNTCLPPSVCVRWAQVVSDDFHARFSAQARSYRYLLLNRQERPALAAHRVGWYHRPLALKDMREGMQVLLGTHDFSAFRAAGCQAKSPVRTLTQAELAQHGDYFVFDFSADGFLHHMIRNIVGTMIYVGNGTYTPDWVGSLLAQRDRRLAPPTFSAAGLYFTGVRYDPQHQLPEVGAGETALFL